MKCFAIKSDNEYIEDVSRPISNSYYYGTKIHSTTEADEAKHYRKVYAPKRWLATSIKRIGEQLKEITKEYNEVKNKGTQNNASWRLSSLSKEKDTLKIVKAFLDNATVVELDMEKPNFPSDHKIRWDSWYRDNGGKPTIRQDTHSRYICKSCGIKLKNIPYYDLACGNPTKVCIPCLYIRLDKIKTAFESMPEDFRNEIVSELILKEI